MANIRSVSIDVTKLDKSRFAKGKYADFAFVYNKNGVDDRGQAGFITQMQTKEERLAKTRLPIVGNFRVWDDSPDHAQPRRTAPQQEPPADLDW